MKQPDQLEAIWREHAAFVWAYAARRVGRVEADDIVAETFLVACRRWDEIELRSPRAWLIGVARRALGDERRSTARRNALIVRVSGEPTSDVELVPDIGDVGLREALLSLKAIDRELLLLIAWDGLSLCRSEPGAWPGRNHSSYAAHAESAKTSLKSGEPLKSGEQGSVL